MNRWLSVSTTAALVAGTSMALVGLAPPAAATGCGTAAGVVTVNLTGLTAGAVHTLAVSAGTITLDGADCGGTTSTVKEVTVFSQYPQAYLSAAAPRLKIDLGGGTFGPGSGTTDVNGTARILISLSDSVIYPVDVIGTGGADTLGFVSDGIDLDGDGDSDVTSTLSYGFPPVFLHGMAGNDTLVNTSSQALTMVPGPGSNTVTGSDSGDDILSLADSGASGAVATVNGTATSGTESDTMTEVDGLVGTAGPDTLTGDGNANTLEGGGGVDALVGGGGFDLATFVNAASGIHADLAAGTVTGGGADGTTLSAISGVRGTEHDDVLEGSAGNDQLDGWAGTDLLRGRAGDDFLEELAGGFGTVAYDQAPAGVQAFMDDITYGDHTGNVSGGDGNDFLALTAGFLGSSFDDAYYGDSSSEVVDLGPGSDLVSPGRGQNDVDGGPGEDLLVWSGLTLFSTLDLTTGVTSADGYPGSTVGIEDVDGGDEPDTVSGITPGQHLLNLGGGTDLASWSSSTAAVTATLDDVHNDGTDGLTDLEAVEGVTGGSGNDTLVGSGAANQLTGGPGGDVLVGRGGDDTLAGSAGTDSLIGGVGDDVLTGGTESDVLLGQDGADLLDGGTGNDTLTGGTGDDDVRGSDGNDLLQEPEAGNGSDILRGGTGTDTVSYAGRTAGIRVSLNNRPDDGATGEYDEVLTDVENVTGGSSNDVLIGSSAANVLHGGPGNDTFDGGLGADALYGDTGSDTASYAARTAVITASLNGLADDGQSGEHDNVHTDVENLTGGTNSDHLGGSSAANTLLGGNGNDTLTGGTGGDRLDGGAGNDVLYARDHVVDRVYGGTGTDKAQVDSGDLRSSVESLF